MLNNFSNRRLVAPRRPGPGICTQNSHVIVENSTVSVNILRATAIGAVATVVAQVVGCPIDVVSKLTIASGRNGLVPRLHAALTLVKNVGPGALFKGLPNHLMKRTPTKALTVCLFEVLRQRDGGKPRTKLQHLQTALLAGSIALIATYPLSVLYYARRKAIPAAAVLNRIRTTAGGVLYAGLLPSVLAVAPSVAIDYSLYSSTRARLAPCARVQVADNRQTTSAILSAPTATSLSPSPPPLITIIVAAAFSKMVAGAIAEPFKMVARRSAVAALKGNAAHAPLVARQLLAKGPLEFWNGFGARSVRYALSAVASRTTVQHLRTIEAATSSR